MNMIKKDSKKFKNRVWILVALISLISLLISKLVLIDFRDNIQKRSKKEAEATILSVSAQNVELINSRFTEKIETLRSISMHLSELKTCSQKELVDHLKHINKVLKFYNLGLTNQSGICLTTLDEKFQLNNYEYIQKGFKGEESFTESYLSEDGTMNLNILSVPVYQDGSIKYVLTATYRSLDYINLLSISSFEGNGSSIVLDKNGDIVADSVIDPTIDYNIFHDKDRVEEELSTMLYDMNNLLKGYVCYYYEGEKFIAYYEPLNFDDWYLVTYVPYKYISSNADEMSNITVKFVSSITMTVFFLMLLLGVTYIYYMKRLNNMIFVDDVTKKKNYNWLENFYTYDKMQQLKDKALLVIDIDNFKMINTKYGIHIGNKVLLEISKIFNEVLKNDSIYRDKNDIFVALIQYDSKEMIISKLKMYQKALDDVISAKILPYFHLSIGISMCSNYDTIELAYNDALIAISEIKGKYTEFYNFSKIEMRYTLEEKKEIEAEFKNAIKNNEFKIWYQPKYDSRDNSVIGAEALVRWQKPDGVIVSPAKFIPTYEENGQIIDLDMEVVRLTCKNISELKNKGIRVVPISINLSRYQVENPLFESTLSQIIHDYQIEPRDIVFEITETALSHNAEKLQEMIASIVNMGFKVHMDDFGMGASGLHTISKFDFVGIKIDKVFIDLIGQKKNDIVLEMIISLIRKLNLEVIAEGVEKEEQVKFLREKNCYIIQGYYFNKPLPEDKFNKLMVEEYN